MVKQNPTNVYFDNFLNYPRWDNNSKDLKLFFKAHEI